MKRYLIAKIDGDKDNPPLRAFVDIHNYKSLINNGYKIVYEDTEEEVPASELISALEAVSI